MGNRKLENIMYKMSEQAFIDTWNEFGCPIEITELDLAIRFLNSLIDNIPYNRNDALRLFTKVGFIDMKEDYFVKKFDNNERVILLELTKERYLNNIVD